MIFKILEAGTVSLGAVPAQDPHHSKQGTSQRYQKRLLHLDVQG